ncbi:MAG: chorismate-binding protein [Tissierellia bacterium]|nr:chorismate-binding protein [Tissierellia bacterium]
MRTMSIIDSLEKSPRRIYSGIIGYLSLYDCANFSIVIRTTVIEKDQSVIGVGGAIIAMSSQEEEYDEILLKAKGSLHAMENYIGKKLHLK